MPEGIAGDYHKPLFGPPAIRVFDVFGAPILREEIEDFEGNIEPELGFSFTLEHEIGHAANDLMRKANAGLTADSRRFRNLCVKHSSGTPGGGGGHGETTHSYSQSRCGELYAAAFEAYYRAPTSLLRYDPQLYEFFKDVDAALRLRYPPSLKPVIPPPLQRATHQRATSPHPWKPPLPSPTRLAPERGERNHDTRPF